MNVLGICFDGILGTGKTLLHHMVRSVRNEEADISVILADNLQITACTECGECLKIRDQGGQIECVIWDDYQQIEEEILNADALVIVCSTELPEIVHKMKNLLKRYSYAKNYIEILEIQQNRVRERSVGLLDNRLLYRKQISTVIIQVDENDSLSSKIEKDIEHVADKCGMNYIGSFRISENLYDPEFISQNNFWHGQL